MRQKGFAVILIVVILAVVGLIFAYLIGGIGKSSNKSTNVVAFKPSVDSGETAGWKIYDFSETVSFRLPLGMKAPLAINAGYYAEESNLPGGTTLQIWGADGTSPTGGKDFYTETKQDIVRNTVFKTKTTTVNGKEAIQFASIRTTRDQVWGGDSALELKGVVVRMDDGRALVITHFKGESLQKNGDFENDDIIFEQIVSTLKIKQ